MKNRKEEFTLLMKQNMKPAYFSALSILGQHDEAMDVSQEAFIRAYNYFDKYDRNKKFFTWYYKILKNLCLNRIRDTKNKRESDLESFSNLLSIESAEETYINEELKNKVSEALLDLKPEEREILILREFENFSYKDIAELLNIPEGSVMSKLFYTRKKLSKKLTSKM
ncbi:MAG: sigma-70 family RNA polymerase sigma factor [Melioribacteraceae bacterium]|nr:sigma-70 family RNA polymerase sigma factor [Melioribacteraceae bacterium]